MAGRMEQAALLTPAGSPATYAGVLVAPQFTDPDVFVPEHGPEPKPLPMRITWTITFLVAIGMATINFGEVWIIEKFVKGKVLLMDQTMRFLEQYGYGLHVVGGTLVLTLAAMFFATIGAGLIVKLKFPDCGGSGLAENKCFLNGSDMGDFFTWQKLGIRICTSILANAAGFPVGREGPSVTIGSNLAFMIAGWLSQPYTAVSMNLGRSHTISVNEAQLQDASRTACAVGGACGIAMIFNAPIGGLLYMFEEMTSLAWPLELTFRVFVATMVCAMLSYAMLKMANKDIEEFIIYERFPHDEKWMREDIPWFMLVAAICGAISAYHTRMMLSVAVYRKQLTEHLKPYVSDALLWETVAFAAFCAIAACTAAAVAGECREGKSEYAQQLTYIRFNCPTAKSDELVQKYNPVASLLVSTSHTAVKILFSGENYGELPFGPDFVAFVVYFLLNVLLSGLPVPGGAFTATMLLGALFGRGFCSFCHDKNVPFFPDNGDRGVYAIIGSAAMLCGFKQMTLTVVLIIVECVEDFALSPVVMLSVAVAITVNRWINPRGHDEEQIHRKNLPFLEGLVPSELEEKHALELCDAIPEDAFLHAQATIDQVMEALEHQNVSAFPVVDQNIGPCAPGRSCLGIVSRSNLEIAKDTINGKLERLDSDCGSDMTATGSKRRLIAIEHIMDPTPITVVDSMPAARLWALFAKADERAVCVETKNGRFCGLVTRKGLIRASQKGLSTEQLDQFNRLVL